MRSASLATAKSGTTRLQIRLVSCNLQYSEVSAHCWPHLAGLTEGGHRAPAVAPIACWQQDTELRATALPGEQPKLQKAACERCLFLKISLLIKQ